AGLLKPEDCRLILPIANQSREVECADILSTGCVNSTDFACVECGMFPLSSNVERLAASAPHLIIADTEIGNYLDGHNRAELRLATRTKTLYFYQQNCRFAWGLTASKRTIHAYVFGPDDIWVSTEMNITSIKGCQALISLLVNWLLSPIDSLGFDPSIRYLVDGSIDSDPYLEIDVDEMDESTGRVEQRTYYSQQCVGAADRLTGRHDRYFAASTSLGMLGTPEFLVKEMWTISNSDSASYAYESWFINELHAEFDQSSEFSGRFPQIIGTGPVYINRGGMLVLDSTVTAFAGLPTTTQDATENSSKPRGLSKSKIQSPSSSNDRQHMRTVLQWTGNIISAAANLSQVVIAISDAMVALNEAFVKCKILHGNLSDRAIQFQKTADGIREVLADFDYASYSGASPDATKADAPEMMLFQSIRALERLVGPEVRGMHSRAHSQARSSRLDDWESILYIICMLGTFGINQADRNEYPAGESSFPHIKTWNLGNTVNATEVKREHMDTERSFYVNIASKMDDGPLRHLAVDMHRILFLHPECHGAMVSLEEVDPLVTRNNFEDAIVTALLALMEKYRREALLALQPQENAVSQNK
ncbi:hypothetical protein GGH93_005733, partial [Coemansia aciculifera]